MEEGVTHAYAVDCQDFGAFVKRRPCLAVDKRRSRVEGVADEQDGVLGITSKRAFETC